MSLPLGLSSGSFARDGDIAAQQTDAGVPVEGHQIVTVLANCGQRRLRSADL